MKKVIFLLLILTSSITNGQKYVINVDRGQNFYHDSSYSTIDAILLNKVNYLTSGQSNLIFTFDFDNMVFTRQFNDETPITKKMTKNSYSNNFIDVLVDYSDGVRSYVVFKNDINYLFVSRIYEGNKITGWFDNNVEIKKRP